MVRRKKKNGWKAILSGVVVLAVTGGVYLYQNGYILQKKVEVVNGVSVLDAGKAVQTTSEAASCGYKDFTWRGYTTGEVEKANCLLDTVTVYHKLNNTPAYQRTRDFGDAWKYDYNNSGCDTRNDILKESLTQVDVTKCKVFRGIYAYDPYTGNKDVVWDKSNAALLQVDHIVALYDAYISGAMKFSSSDKVAKGIASDPLERRQQIANDPLNLVLADGPENISKSKSDASEWLVPKNAEFRCEYVIRQVMVKSKYGLTMTKAEKAAIKRQLSLCV